jgi:hypothetical protein
MQTNRPGILLTLAVVLAITSCKKTTYTYPANPLTNYFAPLQVGKYITYRLDSLSFYYYGQLDTLTRYLAKDSVEEAITDNQGRPSWRVVRYLSDTMGTAWTPNETYMVTATQQTLEMVEDNLRYIKLAFPLDEGFSWTGNTYLPYAPYQDFFDFSDDSHLSVQLWNYTYQQVNKPFSVGNQAYDSTVTVLQVNDSINVPITDPNSFASRTYWTETYARNIGLIYRHTSLWEYQPPTPNGTQTGYKIGFEATLTIVDHN